MVKKILRSLNANTDELIRVSNNLDGVRGKIFESVDRANTDDLVQKALGFKMTKTAGIVGFGAVVGGSMMSGVYGQATKHKHGEVEGGYVANTMNTAQTGVTSPLLNSDIDSFMDNGSFASSYTKENLKPSQRAISGDLVFAMHNLR